jgi:PAS domain S-box-containing protein
MNEKILIIDDEESIRFTFKSFISEEGYSVMTAEDYPSAMKILSKTAPDLIFADIVLPGGKTGIDILREVKKRKLGSQVIFITGKPDIKDASEAVRLGAFDYIVKPVRKTDIQNITRKALNKKETENKIKRLDAERKIIQTNIEAIFRSTKDAIVTVDRSLQIIEANDSAESFCGMNPENVKGKRFEDSIPDCSRACCGALRETIKSGKPVREYRVQCRRPGKAGQTAVLNIEPLMDLNGKLMGVLLVMRDITRLRNMEMELKERNRFHSIVGKSPAMLHIYKMVEHLADQDATVLITGETGTGKELVAEALHNSGSRAAYPFIKVNCSALVEDLLESELFGHVKGAFTGALKDNPGRLRLAERGAIFLDEIGDISPRIQLKLLRVLETKSFEPVGSSAIVNADVRIIASTNRNLKDKVKKGEFREDLYYRLKVVELFIPPLRKRREDIPLLTDHFINLFNQKLNRQVIGVTDDVMKIFMEYSWPGNVREMMHTIEYAFVICRSERIGFDILPTEIRAVHSSMRKESETLSSDEPGRIVNALEKSGGNKAKAARLLGVSRQTLYRKIGQYKL